MRIPVPIAILITILAVAVVWWLRTRNMDFMTPKGTTPPLPDFMARPLEEEDDPGPVVVAPGTNVPNPTPAQVNPEKPPLEFGDLESSPGLAEYSEHGSKGAGYLIRLATELEVQGHFERALLAWERVVDSCHPSDSELTIAVDSIKRIRPTLTFWNIDPEGDVPLLLQLGTSRPVTDHLKEAAQEVADFLRRDSDHTLLITPQITTPQNGQTVAEAPIALYFSGTGEAASEVNDLFSITPKEDSREYYERELLLGCYQLVRRRLLNVGGIVPPRPVSTPDKPRQAFEQQITRLHWKLFAQLVTRPRPAEGE